MSSFRSFVVFGCICELLFGRKPSHIDNPGDMGGHFLPAAGSLVGLLTYVQGVAGCVERTKELFFAL